MEKSFGSGGTGGTGSSSRASPESASDATRSLRYVASLEWILEISLPALFLFALPIECRPEVDTDVMLVVVESEVESRELVVVVGVPVYVVDDADPRLGVKLERALILLDFLGVFSTIEGAS